jgi:CDP-diacylglycerol---glycerol-3-phosphate 3-phosphatidyltransferase
MNLATALTLSRIILAPFFAFAFIHGFNAHSAGSFWVAVGLLFVSEMSDAFDGHVARSRGEVTDFGKVFDPVADSIARLTAIVSFTVCGIIPVWLFLIFLYRDILMSLLRIVCASRGVVLAARGSGKIKAILQALGILGVLVSCMLNIYYDSMIPDTIWGFHPGFWIMLIPALVTVLSVFDYLGPNKKALEEMMKPKKQN